MCVITHVFQLSAICVPSLKTPKLKAFTNFGTHGTRGTPSF
ncbi:hypothetical protein C4K31_5080 [Pseudomonas chlororaphis subsp. piscium]|nr:hypothetical protein C4K31_5080 [Pseudomonas chlororaphis subsp. piscium]